MLTLRAKRSLLWTWLTLVCLKQSIAIRVISFLLRHHRYKPLLESAKKRNVGGSRYVADRNDFHHNMAENFNYGKTKQKDKKTEMDCSLRCLSKNKQTNG
jgi:hypothetical protein